MIYAGIDPGLTGAIAKIDSNNGKCIGVWDMPVISSGKASGKVKTRIDARALFDLLNDVDNIAIEQLHGFPGQNPGVVFSMGYSYATAIAAAQISQSVIYDVPPATWKKYFKISSDKEVARGLAINLCPEQYENFKRKKDHNRAESFLIARWLYERIR